MLERQIIEDAMRRALVLAHRGPYDDPNPRVGCVVLGPGGRIVAEGWHLGSGTRHAEVDALAQLTAEHRARARELTAVVTLEPCNHTGRTGPCTAALISAGIGAVVYALPDPGRASGGGANALRAAGVRVFSGVLADEARELLAPWLARQGAGSRHEHRQRPRQGSSSALPRPTAPYDRRPHVTVKWAQTLDGRAAAADGSSRWITGPEARADVHRRRAGADAILVGTGTLLADDPELTARAADGTLLVPAVRQPMPVVLGRRAIPADARVLQHPALAARGWDAPWQLCGVDLAADLAALAERGVHRLFVEGGPAVASSLIAAGVVDEVLVYLAPALLGGPRLALGDIGIASIDGIARLRVDRGTGRGTGREDLGVERLGDDLLVRGSLLHPALHPVETPGPPAEPPVERRKN
ncbi:dihydrofolate reductase family protein [Leucobacter sp. gxy201]|uniref:bifunctional diaminohydroxyphosphoribosylaminopyrimidine deaminase/5-amino-6-(5-phosphoribosylamino)uracil reductase RibD n=1 Tax=Leucobacter sp. gxy201 TaxID=2957200 RepID=UPI003DA16D80